MRPIVLSLVLWGCDADDPVEQMPEQREPLPPNWVERPDEPHIVHGEVDAVDGPPLTKFRGPFPNSLESLNRPTGAFVPWSYAHARLCSDDERIRGALLESLRQASTSGELTDELDSSYSNLLSWCPAASHCAWLADVATTDPEPAVRELAWGQVAMCPAPHVRSAMESHDSPDPELLHWYKLTGAGGSTLPARLVDAADRIIGVYIVNREPGRLLQLAELLARFSDPQVRSLFDEMLANAEESTARELYRILVRLPEDWAKQRIRKPCRRGVLTPDECLPPAHPYDPYLFEEPLAFEASVRRFDRAQLVDRLEACVFSRDAVDTFFRTRCLNRLARLDWRRGIRAAESFSPDDDDLRDVELGPVIGTLLDNYDAPLEVTLRRYDLIGPSAPADGPLTEGVDALSVMTRYGRAWTAGAGVFTDAYEQSWTLHDLSQLGGVLEGAAFEVLVEPVDGGTRRQVVAYLDGRRYTHTFHQEFDDDGVAAMLVLLNGMLVDRGRPERFVVGAMDDIGVTFALGDAQKLEAALAASVLRFVLPASF